jgi:hypothetical protein
MDNQQKIVFLYLNGSPCSWNITFAEGRRSSSSWTHGCTFIAKYHCADRTKISTSVRV